jgi:hypothetical protein
VNGHKGGDGILRSLSKGVQEKFDKILSSFAMQLKCKQQRVEPTLKDVFDEDMLLTPNSSKKIKKKHLSHDKAQALADGADQADCEVDVLFDISAVVSSSAPANASTTSDCEDGKAVGVMPINVPIDASEALLSALHAQGKQLQASLHDAGVSISLKAFPATLVHLGALDECMRSTTVPSSSNGKGKKGKALAELSDIIDDIKTSIVDADWAAFMTALRYGSVSVTKYDTLIVLAVVCNRIDVIMHIARFSADLTERQALALLCYCSCLSDSVIMRMEVTNGMLCWVSDADGDDESSQRKKKVQATPKKSARKSKKALAAEPVDTLASLGSVDEKRATVVLSCIHALLSRKDAFSSILLSDALQGLSSTSCAAILYAFASLLQSAVCPTQTKAGEISNTMGGIISAFRDVHVRRAAVWVEALLDAHFTALAMSASAAAREDPALASFDTTSLLKATNLNPAVSSLHQLANVAGSAQRSATELGSVLGMWSHITRMKSAPAAHSNPPPAMYSIDRLEL